ncbi:MAG: TetR family transcriptional regulator [Verrucomicrobiae bacterium]|nr:TetR family transcriptional regulator [Verrucomicrobiae bacterium]NNJ86625.1 TetR/AcrR family transcriptional regulator [Akkermansiaceae bacterium]
MLAEKKSTKTLILETTERLLAEHGFESVSLRDITKAAEVNVAAVNYHFGSKEKLFEEIQCRYIEPVNGDRLSMLDDLTREGRVATVREILEAFMRPFLITVKRSEMSQKLFFKLMGRCLVDHGGDLPEAMVPGMKKVAEAYTQAIITALPELSVEQVLWRLHYVSGVMTQTLLHGDLLLKLTEGACGDPDAETQFQQMITFCEAGFLTMEGVGE